MDPIGPPAMSDDERRQQVLQQMVDAGLVPMRSDLLAAQMKRGQGLMATPSAQGMNVPGATYVAASPLEHAAAAMARIMGGREVDSAEKGMQGLIGQLRDARLAYGNGAGAPPESPAASAPAQQIPSLLARPSDQAPAWSPPDFAPQAPASPAEAPRMLSVPRQVGMSPGALAALSGDPAIMAAGKAQTDEAVRQANMALQGRHLDAQLAQHADQVAHQNAQLKETTRHDLAVERLGGEKYVAGGWTLKQTVNGQNVWVNGHTGEVRAVGPNGERADVLTPGSGPGYAPAPATSPSPAPAPGASSGGGTQTSPAPSATLYAPLGGKVLDKAIKDFGADLDPNKGTGEIQKNQARLNAAIRLRKLVTNEDGSIKDMIPPQFMKETAMALAQLINSGGQPAQSLIDELTPHTGSSKIADWEQWITAHPQDAGQQAFVKLYLESANREATAAKDALDKAVSARVGKHQRLIRGNPDAARQVAQPYGWDISPDGRLVPLGDSGEASALASGNPRKVVGGKTYEKRTDGWYEVP